MQIRRYRFESGFVPGLILIRPVKTKEFLNSLLDG